MEINHSAYTIAEIISGFTRKDIRINRSYQRSGGIWPQSAQAYFIDTILEQYPFPKLYFHQIYDRTLKKPIMEVVDGQQRLQTILDFAQDKIRLSKASQKHSGLTYSELDETNQEAFQMYRVPVDVILAAERPQLLEMFRRMNAYTAPLNPAEKRHSIYQGKFKWFAVELADKISPILEEFGILTTKQIIRMADSELIAELVLVLEEGLINRTESSIYNVYKKYDVNFEREEEYANIIRHFFQMIASHFGELRNTFIMKTYAVHSLFSAYTHIKFGIPKGEESLGFPSRGKDIKTDDETLNKLIQISDAHETKDIDGPYGEYVKAAISTTTKAAQRKARTKILADVLDPK
jgi:hypothetical protein